MDVGQLMINLPKEEGAIPHHGFKLVRKVLTPKNIAELLDDNSELPRDFPRFFAARLQLQKKKLLEASCIYLLGMKSLGTPESIDCGVCGYKTCDEFLHKNDAKPPICPIQIGSFYQCLDRAQTYLENEGVYNFALRSFALLAKMEGYLSSDFQMSLAIYPDRKANRPIDNKLPLNIVSFEESNWSGNKSKL